MKTLEVTIKLKVSDDIDMDDIILKEDDVIDGYQLTRNGYDEDLTETFKIKSGAITSIKQIK